MSMVAFDTLKLARKLRDAGMPADQAEAVAEAFGEFVHAYLATKDDINDFRTDTKAEFAKVRQEIADLRAELKHDIADLRAETQAEFTKVRQEIGSLRVELKQDIAGLRSELYRALLMQTFAIAGIVFALLKLVG